MRLSNIAHLYVVRLKARVVLVQELFAVLGIAVGVALLFASQVASTSLDASVSQLANGVVGQSKYQLKARGQQGFSESLLGEVQRLPGVRATIPVLEQQVVVSSPRGSQSVDLIATNPRYVHLAGRLLRNFRAAQLIKNIVALPAPVASKLDVGPFEGIKLHVGARVVNAIVGIELTERSIGPLVNNPVAIVSLAYAQRLTKMQGRITRLLVQVQPGDDQKVRAGLSKLAAGTINVEPANFDATLFGQAAEPINQTTILFSTICALVGFMFAYCSMLLTTHLRRGLIRDLRRDGATRWGVVKTLLFDALVLGCVASLLGLIMGKALSTLVFGSNPGYLSFGFPIGSAQIVTWQSVVIAVGAGMLAACVGVMTPLRVTSMRVPRARVESASSIFNLWKGVMLGGGLMCLGVPTAVLLTGVQSVQVAVIAIVSLIAALLLFLPLLIDSVIATFDALQKRIGTGSTEVAVLELRSPYTRARSIAIAATGAIAVFGSVAIQGGSANLQGGLDRLFHDVSNVTDLWVVPPGEQDLLTTTSFSGISASTLAGLPGVRSVGEYRAGFLEYGDRRVWVLAPPPTASSPLPPSQLMTGDVALANARLRKGGWAVVSRTLATVHHLHVGQTFILPSPRKIALRVAAFTTNLGWPPGAIILNGEDYSHAWESSDPSAYNVLLAPGVSSRQVRREIEHALGPRSGLIVQTAHEHEQDQRAASRKGLSRLTQIALLVLIAAVFAMAISMCALVWQRRRRFARMKVQGYNSLTLWYALICESVLLLGTGCLMGAVAGIYSEILQSHALVAVTGFPIVISVHALPAFLSFALVTAVAAAIIAIPGYRAAGTAPYPWSET